MAFTSVTEVTTAEMAGVAATTLVLTVPAGGVAVGEAVIVCGGGFKVISSVADSKGNTYAVAQTAGDGSTKCGSIAYSASVATELVNGDTITITWSASATNGCASAFKVAYTGTFALDVSTSGADAVGNSAVTTGTTAGLADSAELYFMALGRDGVSTVTLTHTTSGLTTGTQVNTSAGTARTLHTAYKILSGDSTGQTYAGTLSAVRSWGCPLTLFKAVGAGDPAPAVEGLRLRMLIGVGL